ncbi:MAG: phenylalanine--tRNA ligase subunit beta [Stagnimonas sp.]|nr:phenylalanine--tRNA ligase subunit beta [Stagnimonas sp.]
MQLSMNWLREWVNPAAGAIELAHKLNMAGLEAEATELSADPLQGVVVGRILTADKHPQADRLRVCTVDIGSGAPAQIVCGAPNARVGLCAPVATVGSTLPGGIEIKAAQLRGVDSAGMLCSAKELALSDKSEGLLELDDSATPGAAIADYLKLDDMRLTLELTPNRGDCLSITGLAREVGALYGLQPCKPGTEAVAITCDKTVAVTLEDATACTRYLGRVIEGINPEARTPDWLRERLRRSGIRSIHPIVDITNFVMLELGQPMHAFDLAKLGGPIHVRRARAGETLKLLTEETVTLRQELLITSGDQPVAMAGVMGGAASGVTTATTNIFFESAAFAPAAVVGAARRHKLSSDAAYRYERGVDSALQAEALDRATALALAICGGQAGPVTAAGGEVTAAAIPLRHQKVNDLLGVSIPAGEVAALLESLGIIVTPSGEGAWHCTPPSWRFDLAIEQDLIEEVGRLFGYENIAAKPYAATLIPPANSEARRPAARIRDALVARGWQEAVTYSFVDPKIQARLTPDFVGLPLDNPIAETMAVMRTTLWTGLIGAWLHNHQRQMKRVRFFELAGTFAENSGQIIETPCLAGLAFGNVRTEQWSDKARPVDFYDLKADVEALCAAFGGDVPRFTFAAGTHSALHPGRTAVLMRDDQSVGVLGELHPELVRGLDLPGAPLLFELDWSRLSAARVPVAQPVPEFPTSRRDLALVVDESVPAQALIDAAKTAAGPHLAQAFVFDIYRGQGLRDASKSVAMGLIFQDYSRTLTVEEIDMQVTGIVTALSQKLGASLRG